MVKTPHLWAARLQDALRATGECPNAVAKRIGVERSTVARFLDSDRRDISLSTAERLAALVGLDLLPSKGLENEQ